MLYKLAKLSAKEKRKLERDAIKRAKEHVTLDLLESSMSDKNRGLMSGTAGYIHGKKKGHETVGAFWGPIGLNGAIAKNTGYSTFWPTVKTTGKTMATYTGILGGLGGALVGGRAGLGGALVGAGVGGLTGAGIGGLAGGLHGAINYGAGYLLAEKKKTKSKK